MTEQHEFPEHLDHIFSNLFYLWSKLTEPEEADDGWAGQQQIYNGISIAAVLRVVQLNHSLLTTVE